MLNRPERGSFNVDELEYDDPKIWASFQRGDCLGIFQVETDLTTYWTKRLRPSNIEELSDVISLVRPGPLESNETEKYAKRKSGEEPLEYLHPALEPILKDTQGIVCYQESCSKIADIIAGFPPLKQEALRKSLSKKKPDEISLAKIDFIESATKKGVVDRKMAEEIFAIIEKFQRYGFCKAHGIEYAQNSYKSMACKVHFPTEFFCAWLTFADEKLEPALERAKLINEAKLKGIKVLPPDIRIKNVNFDIIEDKKILFGLSHIRGVGPSAIDRLSSVRGLENPENFYKSSQTIRRNVCESLIKSGACDCYGLERGMLLRLLYTILGRSDNDSEEELGQFKKLTPNEYKAFARGLDYAKEQKNLFVDNIGIVENFKQALLYIIEDKGCTTKRVPVIEAKVKYLGETVKDSHTQRAIWEKLYLGIPLSTSAANDYSKVMENTKSCRDAYRINNREKINLHCVIDDINIKKTSEKAKNPGQIFAILSVSDNSAAIPNLFMWPEKYEQFGNDLRIGAVVAISCRKNNYNGRDNFTVESFELVG